MELYIGVLLGAIFAFVVFRMMGRKILKPDKSVKGEAKGIDKLSGFLIALALAVVVFVAVAIAIVLPQLA